MLCFLLFFSVAKADDDLSAANSAYAGGSYEEAAGLFQKIVDQRGFSAPLCFDLANAQARAGHAGQALLNYERARYLAPADTEIDHNLQLERKKLGLKPNSYRWWEIMLRSIDWSVWMGCIAAGLVLIFLAIVGFSYLPVLSARTKIPLPVLRTVFRLVLFIGIPLCLLLGFIELSTLGFNQRIDGVIVATKSAMVLGLAVRHVRPPRGDCGGRSGDGGGQAQRLPVGCRPRQHVRVGEGFRCGAGDCGKLLKLVRSGAWLAISLHRNGFI